MMYALFLDPIKDTQALDHSGFVEFVELGDGLVAFKTWDGKYVSQEPNQRGVFRNVDAIGPFETFAGGAGQGMKSSWTRPPNDAIFQYWCAQLAG